MKILNEIELLIKNPDINPMDVLYQIQCDGIDFSECTKREFSAAVKRAVRHIMAGTHYERKL